MRLGLLVLTFLPAVVAAIDVLQSTTTVQVANARLNATWQKSIGAIVDLTLDGRDLLGEKSGSTGIGPYLDCYCIPSGFYTVGTSTPRWDVIEGVDGSDTPWVGVVLSDTYAPTNQTFQQYWFLRGEETGFHMFTRVAYYNAASPFLRNLQELRTLFRPNAALGLWTHLSVNSERWAPLPGQDAMRNAVVVQDATWSLRNTPQDPYVTQFSEFFTKYSFSSDWRSAIAHGMFADGGTSDGVAYGAWLVMNSKDTYFGGPLHSDLTVDGIVYNYIVSNHHGEGTPNITHGFDRTFGPQYYHFNSAPGASLADLRRDAEKLAAPGWNAGFYASIESHVVGYVPSASRGKWRGMITLPKGAARPIAVLSADGYSFQDNAFDTRALQYWGEIDVRTGRVAIDRVAAGRYRLTVYADGIFGDFVRPGVVVAAGKTTTTSATWREESAGRELWRIGTPDKSSGEFRHGVGRSPLTPLAPPEYLIFWGAYDFPSDFPQGVNYTVGVSDPKTDWNYVHWSVFGPTPSRADRAAADTAAWTVNFALNRSALCGRTKATLTIQLAAVKGASGNTDVLAPTEPWSNVPLTAFVNGREAGKLVVPWYRSSSCAVRSAVSCYQVAAKIAFAAAWMTPGWNSVVLALPANATDTQTALLTDAIYVQYDAVRLEVA